MLTRRRRRAWSARKARHSDRHYHMHFISIFLSSHASNYNVNLITLTRIAVNDWHQLCTNHTLHNGRQIQQGNKNKERKKRAILEKITNQHSLRMNYIVFFLGRLFACVPVNVCLTELTFYFKVLENGNEWSVGARCTWGTRRPITIEVWHPKVIWARVHETWRQHVSMISKYTLCDRDSM